MNVSRAGRANTAIMIYIMYILSGTLLDPNPQSNDNDVYVIIIIMIIIVKSLDKLPRMHTAQ